MRAEHRILYMAVTFFVAVRLALLFMHHDIRWDEAVYLTMAKHLASGGAVGYWEVLRPPLLPMILAPLLLTGMPVLLAELLLLATAVGGALVLYAILEDEVRPWIAASAAAMLLLSDIWFWHSGLILTDVPSATLALLAFWLLKRGRHTLCGAAAAAAFLMRFPAGLVFIGLAVALAARTRSEGWRDVLASGVRIAAGAAVLVLPWLATNALVWGDGGLIAGALRPLTQGGSVAIVQSAEYFTHSWSYYLAGLLTVLPITVLALVGLPSAYRRSVPLGLGAMGLAALVFFSTIENQQWRFAILILPGVLTLTALGMERAARATRSAPKAIGVAAVAMLVVLAVTDFGFINHRPPGPTQIETDYYRHFDARQLSGIVLVADPVAAWYVDAPALPIYYEFQGQATEALRDAAAVFYVPYQMPCPAGDTGCAAAREELLSTLTEEFVLERNLTYAGEEHYIFVRRGLNASS